MTSMDLDYGGTKYVESKMPPIGLGTWQIQSAKEINKVLDAALEAGYRFIDTAQVYKNEEKIGDALKELLPKHGLKREDIFITSKLAPINQGEENCEKSVLQSLKNLQTDYLDLFLIHWPGAGKLRADNPANSVNRMNSWKILENLYKGGKLRAIGVSNYNTKHLQGLFEHAIVAPAVNQCEYHPYFYQPDLIDYCKQKKIHFQAYSSLGSESHKSDLFADNKIQEMAKKYKCTVTDFLLAWSICQGISVLPRSTNPDHIRANLRALDVKINEEDIEEVKSGKQMKTCWDPSKVV